MLMPFPSIIVALTGFIVGPDESTSTVTHSLAHLRVVFRQRRGFPVIVSDRQMTSACPRVALGRRHLLLIKQNKGGLWWYHLGVAPPPPHCHCHTTGDFHFPVIEFLSRFFVFGWRSDEVPPPQNLLPLFCTETHPHRRVCVYLFPTSVHVMNIYHRN